MSSAPAPRAMRFDHAIILVSDLGAARRRYEDLGFSVADGGRHPNGATYNALIYFGVDTLELLSVHDLRRARELGGVAGALVETLALGDGGAGLVLATSGLDAMAERMNASGLVTASPIDARRERPDGVVMAWRMLFPGGPGWRRTWPLLVDWGEAGSIPAVPSAHSNGALGIAGVSVAVADMPAAAAVYSDGFGLEPGAPVRRAELAGVSAPIEVGGATIGLVSADGPGPVARELAARGEGLFEVTFQGEGGSRPRVVEPENACGVRLVFNG